MHVSSEKSTSVWIGTTVLDDAPALDRDEKADVVVVGSGIAGMSVASTTTFVLSRLSIKADGSTGMPIWQDHLFISLTNNAIDATEYFSIPRSRVVEIGTQLGV